MGDKYDWFLNLQADGFPTPILDEEPFLEQEASYYWNIFTYLSNSRDIGMQMGYIHLSEMQAYCVLFNVDDPEEILALVEIISQVDGHYVEQQREKQKSDAK